MNRDLQNNSCASPMCRLAPVCREHPSGALCGMQVFRLRFASAEGLSPGSTRRSTAGLQTASRPATPSVWHSERPRITPDPIIPVGDTRYPRKGHLKSPKNRPISIDRRNASLARRDSMPRDGRAPPATRVSAEATAVAVNGAPCGSGWKAERSRRAEVIVEGLNGRPSGKGWMARCPAHPDTTPSLSINETPAGKVLVKCFAGCSQAEVIAALRRRGLWPGRSQRMAIEATPVLQNDRCPPARALERM